MLLLYIALISYGCILLFVDILICLFILRKCFSGITKNEFKCSLRLVVLSIFITVQPEIIQSNLQFLICRKIQGDYYSLADPYINCKENYYKNVVFPINMGFFVIMGLVLPACLALQLYGKYKRKQLKKVDNLRIYGFFYNELKENMFYWDFVLILMKILVATISTIYYETEGIKLSLIMFLLGILTVLAEKIKPYLKNEMTNMLIYSTRILILTLLIESTVSQVKYSNNESKGFYEVVSMYTIVTINFIFVIKVGIKLFPYFDYSMRGNRMYSFFRNRIPFLKKHHQLLEKEAKARYLWSKLSYRVSHGIKKKVIQQEHNEQKLKVLKSIETDHLDKRLSLRSITLSKKEDFKNFMEKTKDIENRKTQSMRIITENQFGLTLKESQQDLFSPSMGQMDIKDKDLDEFFQEKFLFQSPPESKRILLKQKEKQSEIIDYNNGQFKSK